MFLYDCYYFENGKKYVIDFYVDNLQQAILRMQQYLNLSDYDIELSKKKNSNGDCVADYVLYKHATKTTYYINKR